MFQHNSQQGSAPRGQDAAETASHTPTPWMTQPCGELLPDDVMIVADMGKLPNGYARISTVARALSIRQTKEVTAANAALIVKAVNSHQALLARVARLEADLLECREFLENEVDVIDGDYGESDPNRAMKLVSMIDETLNGRPY